VTHSHEDRVDRVILEYLQAVDGGEQPDRGALLARHPDLAAELQEFFADQDRVAQAARRAQPPTPLEATTDEAARHAGAAPLVPPATVGGYRLLRLLGEGGMGRVYEAEDAAGQRVAIKLLAPGAADSPPALERFRQEGRLASRVTHPRCVFVRTADEEAGRPYIVMELMSGVTLKDLVESAGRASGAEGRGPLDASAVAGGRLRGRLALGRVRGAGRGAARRLGRRARAAGLARGTAAPGAARRGAVRRGR
jgi:hypothetical protein